MIGGVHGGAVKAQSLVGRRVLGVTSSWYMQSGKRFSCPVHVWLRLDRLGNVMLDTSGEGVGVTLTEPDAGYEIPAEATRSSSVGRWRPVDLPSLSRSDVRQNRVSRKPDLSRTS